MVDRHRLAQTEVYKDPGSATSAPSTPALRRQAGPVIEFYFEKAGVRLAYLLDTALK